MKLLDPLHALMNRLIFHLDGSVTNPDGIDDPRFFEALNDIRKRSRSSALRDPFVERDPPSKGFQTKI